MGSKTAFFCVLALLMGAAHADLASGTMPKLDDYDYNGVTTYCYWLKQGLSVSRFDYTYVKLEGKGKQCPLEITIKQTTTGAVYAGGDVEYQFTGTLNFNDNSFGMTALEATVRDPSSKLPVQIGHANVHACSSSTVCDVFRDGANRRISGQETSNFTDGKASFTQKVNFALAGEYNVFAHIVLPPKNAANETYQFVTFTRTTISSLEASTTSSGDGMNAGTTVGIVVGVVALVLLLVIAVIFNRRRKPLMTPGNDHFRHSGFVPSHTTKNSRMDWNGDPEFQFGHDRFQSSMASEYKQPPGLSASALMFQEKPSRPSHLARQKTASSSGSLASPRSYHYQNSVGVQLPPPLGLDTYETFYQQPEPAYDVHGKVLQSYTTDGSVGTHKMYGGAYDHHGYDNVPPLYESTASGEYPYDRESDLSSLNDYEYQNRHRGESGDTLRPVSEVSRDSDASMSTVDFGLPPGLRLNPPLRDTADSFQAHDVPNLADTKLTFNDEEVSKQTIEYIHSLRQQNDYRESDQASDYVSDFGDTQRTFDFRDSTQSNDFYRSTNNFTDTNYRNKRVPSADSESYEF